MSILISAIVFIAIFSLLIFVHEFGHFITAKRSGIKVEEFGFGLPPRAWGKKKGETIYSINWIPFGGFVRMLGEDSDEGMLKKKRSFVAQPLRVRMKVVVAGVVMNFLLAWVLLIIGFSIGMKPFLMGTDDVLPAIKSGLVEVTEGVEIESVELSSLGATLGLQAGDVIYEVDDVSVSAFNFDTLLTEAGHDFALYREGKSFTYEVGDAVEIVEGTNILGVSFVLPHSLPRVKIFDLDRISPGYRAGLRAGDVILSVNGVELFYESDFAELAKGQSLLVYEIYRDNAVETVLVENKESKRIVISGVFPDSPADLAGLEEGDVVISVNAKTFSGREAFVEFISNNQDSKMAYLIERGGERQFYEMATNESGLIGVVLSELINFGTAEGMSLYQHSLLSSLDVQDEQYPFFTAVFKSLDEIWRLSKLTAAGFGDFVVGVFTRGEVADEVGGPVAIAQITHIVVQEGAMPLLQLVALLSLTLAVINILPFPALDGGKLLFLIIEMLSGKRVNQKMEGMIHMLGYVLILFLILLLTYNDIVRLFSG
ncbi:RIP metalloprotease RseP [Candidatus Gracilibacteria bacterium]|nr:RIP metalloprotease RseP [Candidatus Gracilibacteria bacterium]